MTRAIDERPVTSPGFNPYSSGLAVMTSLW